MLVFISLCSSTGFQETLLPTPISCAYIQLQTSWVAGRTLIPCSPLRATLAVLDIEENEKLWHIKKKHLTEICNVSLNDVLLRESWRGWFCELLFEDSLQDATASKHLQMLAQFSKARVQLDILGVVIAELEPEVRLRKWVNIVVKREGTKTTCVNSLVYTGDSGKNGGQQYVI